MVVLLVIGSAVGLWRAAGASMAAKPKVSSASLAPAVMTEDVQSDAPMDALMAELARNQPLYAAVHEARVLRGRDVSEWLFEVKRLKAEGQLEEALALAYECSDTQERSHAIFAQITRDGVPMRTSPYWSKDIAIILRKMKDYDAEVGYLEEKLDADPENMEINARLSKARVLAAKDAAL
ncbi:hypothetical protein E3T61_18430 [Cryobacterium lactosi]|uniref:Uncharacterized protein n=1 Tax=Cryobacterium lactosi TaxID=1259202 RepID=A0A4R9BK55_9MICO|nr:hypothetical protein [Cryobacterium lactosi]TFD84997.1 hypothetical protein E3T61_18430 [Cryobacterium lactosi]